MAVGANRNQPQIAHLRLRDDAHRQDSELPQLGLQGQLSLSRHTGGQVGQGTVPRLGLARPEHSQAEAQ